MQRTILGIAALVAGYSSACHPSTVQAEVRDLEVIAVAGKPFGVGRITLDRIADGADRNEPAAGQPRRGILGGIILGGPGRPGMAPGGPITADGGILGRGGLVEGILGGGGGGLPDPQLLAEGLLGTPELGPLFCADEAEGRVLYATLGTSGNRVQPVRGLIRGILGGQRSERSGVATAYFLFQGDEPFKLRVHSPERFETEVHPIASDSQHRELLAAWWDSYAGGRSGLFAKGNDYPRNVESFLRLTLARRLGLPAPAEERTPLLSFSGLMGEPQMGSALAPLLGTESLRQDLQRNLLLATSAEQPADRALPQLPPAPVAAAVEPLPAPGEQPADNGAVAQDDVAIEEMAKHVPEECFYLRFGNFANFWWLKTIIDRAEGDLSTLFLTSAVKYEISERMQDRLEIRDILLADVVGPFVIKDAAIIGSDVFLREGAAIGFLLRAENTEVLGNFIRSQRKAALKKYDDVVLEDVDLAGRTVSFLHTPDNRVRSFYAEVGDYHFATTSKALMIRFFEASEGRGSLANSADFREARRKMPLTRRDAMFAYLSPSVFENLASPHYRVEMMRRLKSQVRLEATTLARFVAQREGQPSDTVEALIEGGYLPPGFNQPADGSTISFVNGRPIDSLRGGYGSLIPVPDVELTQITPTEESQYREFAQSYRNDWGKMPAVVVGLQREVEAGGKQDRVKIDIEASPIVKTPLVMQLMQMMSGNSGLQLKFGGDMLIPQLGFAPAEPADGPQENHISISDLRDSSVALFLDPMAERQAKRTLYGTIEYLNAMHDQLGVPIEDCLAVAEQIVDGKLVSSTGGEFVLKQDAECPRWTHRPDDSRAGQHAFRPLNWCRSLDARWKLADRELTAHIDVLLELPLPVVVVPEAGKQP